MTIVEITITLLCLGIAAAIVLPTITDNSPEQLRAAARMLVGDIQFTQAQSMSNGDDPRMLVISDDKSGYRITKRSDPATAVTNPIGEMPYVTRYGTGRAAYLGKVSVGRVSFNGDTQLGFAGLGQLDQTTPATITLTAGLRSITITIDPITGDAATGEIQ
jgi:type II secretory pathway pseudopilin PulG